MRNYELSTTDCSFEGNPRGYYEKSDSIQVGRHNTAQVVNLLHFFYRDTIINSNTNRQSEMCTLNISSLSNISPFIVVNAHIDTRVSTIIRDIAWININSTSSTVI
jgi:hypothetical protein